mgnify:CR=1 FL=1
MIEKEKDLDPGIEIPAAIEKGLLPAIEIEVVTISTDPMDRDGFSMFCFVKFRL